MGGERLGSWLVSVGRQATLVGALVRGKGDAAKDALGLCVLIGEDSMRVRCESKREDEKGTAK